MITAGTRKTKRKLNSPKIGIRSMSKWSWTSEVLLDWEYDHKLGRYLSGNIERLWGRQWKNRRKHQVQYAIFIALKSSYTIDNILIGIIVKVYVR
uniref:Uncharacterized protein n=1 Tax=Glossina palpalis gambiensis TaxID=67801 RepID=A0A1B0B2J0_9MUSC